MTKLRVGAGRRWALGLLACVALGLWLQLRRQGTQPTSKVATPSAVASSPPMTTVTSAAASSAPNSAADLASPILSIADTPPPEDEYSRMLADLNHTDKQAALVLAEKGEQWYAPVGRLAEARRAMRITLLVDLERMTEARALTHEFIERHPESPYRRLVQGVTGIHPRPSGPRPVSTARDTAPRDTAPRDTAP